jgi:hypothetical protein
VAVLSVSAEKESESEGKYKCGEIERRAEGQVITPFTPLLVFFTNNLKIKNKTSEIKSIDDKVESGSDV